MRSGLSAHMIEGGKYYPMIDAVRQYMHRASVPIFAEREDFTDPIGTAALFNVEGRYFLVTAAHIIEDENLEKLSSPVGRIKAQIFTWGEFDIVNYKKSLDLDVAVIELKSPQFIESLANTYTVLTLDQIGVVNADEAHWLVGYPAALTTVTDTSVDQAAISLPTKLLPKAPRNVQNPKPEFDLFFHLEKTGRLDDGTEVAIPRLGGASGAPIWQISDYEGEFWAPSKVAKIIGVQRSEVHGSWFRATRWVTVGPLLGSLVSASATGPAGTS